jgi:hypothetical protein
MYFDDALNLEGAGAGVLLISRQGEQLLEAWSIKIEFASLYFREIYLWCDALGF